MASRRARKRYRRLAGQQGQGADRRGDRPDSPAPAELDPRGGSGDKFGLWADPTRRELGLLRRSIREDWPTPRPHRRRIVAEVFEFLRTPYDLGNAKECMRHLRAVQVFTDLHIK